MINNSPYPHILVISHRSAKSASSFLKISATFSVDSKKREDVVPRPLSLFPVEVEVP